MTIKPGKIPKPMKYYRSIDVGDLIFAERSELKSTMEELKLQGQWLLKSIAVEKLLSDKVRRLTENLINCTCRPSPAVIGREQRENQGLNREVAQSAIAAQQWANH